MFESHVEQMLAVEDLTVPREPPHAIFLVVERVRQILAELYGCEIVVIHGERIVSLKDNYRRLFFTQDAIDADATTIRLGNDQMLRSHTTACIPDALSKVPVDDATHVVVVAGRVFRREVIDVDHSCVPHQMDIWPIRTSGRVFGSSDLDELVDALVYGLLPGVSFQTLNKTQPYNADAREVHVQVDDSSHEILECGVALPRLLAQAGLPQTASGLGLGLGLERTVMLMKGIDDIGLLHSADPRVACQMHDLKPYVEVPQGLTVRELTVECDTPMGDRDLGSTIRAVLGPSDVLVVAATVPEVQRVASRYRVRIRLTLRTGDSSTATQDVGTVLDALTIALESGSRRA